MSHCGDPLSRGGGSERAFLYEAHLLWRPTRCLFCEASFRSPYFYWKRFIICTTEMAGITTLWFVDCDGLERAMVWS